MIKKRRMPLIIGVVFITCFMLFYGISFVSAVEDVSLKITGVVGDYGSDVRLRTDSNSDSSLDSYDMPKTSLPSTSVNFYSSITSASLAIDSWDESERDVVLRYDLPSGTSGDVDFVWNSISTSDYRAYLSITGSVTDLDMGSSSSYSYSATDGEDIYITVKIRNPATASSDDSGSGGGGGGGSAVTGNDLEIISNDEMNIYMVVDQNSKEQKITIRNNANVTKTLSLSSSGFDLISDKSITLEPGETKDISFKIRAIESSGVYTGKILVGGKEILVSLNVNTKELLFDASVVVPESYKIISAGDNLDSQITLIPMTENPRVDVTLTYIIKDFEGRTFLKESETILVEGQKSFSKSFKTGNLPSGKYVLALEVSYPNYVATSSSNFEVRGKSGMAITGYKLVAIALGMGVIILIIMILIIMRGYKKIRKHRR